VLNQAAFGYLRSRGLPGPLNARLAEAGETRFIDQTAWEAHLNRLGIVSAKIGLAVCLTRSVEGTAVCSRANLVRRLTVSLAA
jgi:hypothetical protein